MDDYTIEKQALEYALDALRDDTIAQLRRLTDMQLDTLIDALDWLAAYADAEAIRRVEKRPIKVDDL